MIDPIPTVRWSSGRLRLIDQTRLPTEWVEVECRTVAEVWEAIRQLRVRGAPAIGIAAAYGVALAAWNAPTNALASVRKAALQAADYLATSRPTAVNLFWALDRMRQVAQTAPVSDAEELRHRLLAEAQAIHEEDLELSRAIGQHGAALVEDGDGILTHCNAGGLATSGYGTALAVLYTAHSQGKRFRVYVDETRPLLQGARLTAWELLRAGIETILITDNAAGHVLATGRVRLIITGADRIATNGDTANKIGTYSLAVLARYHGVPFYVAAPTTTLDFSLADGTAIPIEERDPREITHGFGRQTAPDGVSVYAPAFDVTPAELITAIITEKGIHRPPYSQTLPHPQPNPGR